MNLKKNILLTIIVFVLLIVNMYANESIQINKNEHSLGESISNIYSDIKNSQVSDVETAERKAEIIENKTNHMHSSQLENMFCPLQDYPEYFKDRKCRISMRPDEIQEVISYKPNFGKKIWLKSWKEKKLLDQKELFGNVIKTKKYKVGALELEEEVAPFLREKLKDTEINIEDWSNRFEEWGRTYFDMRKGGKAINTIEVYDYENGNYISLKRNAYFISERYQKLIDAIFEYKTMRERGKDN